MKGKISTGSLSSSHNLLVGLLSLFLAFFLADAAASCLNGFFVFLGIHFFESFHTVISLTMLLLGLVTYSTMGLCPSVPKRYLVPLLLFQTIASMASLFAQIVSFRHLFHNPNFLYPFELFLSLAQGAVGSAVIFRLQGGWRWRWPLFPGERLLDREFSWWTFARVHLAAVGLMFGLLFYLGFCASFACARFTDGFLTLHFHGMDLRAKTFSRSDGKVVQLIPMIHIGDERFYPLVASSIPLEASVLLEGVSDKKHLLGEKLDYGPLASALHLSSQRESFVLPQVKKRYADLDVDDFSPSTINLLKSVIHTMNLLTRSQDDPGAGLELLASSNVPLSVDQVVQDVLLRRNEHLLGELDKELLVSDQVAIPWGVAHMPGLSEAIEAKGFHLTRTQEFPVWSFVRK